MSDAGDGKESMQRARLWSVSCSTWGTLTPYSVALYSRLLQYMSCSQLCPILLLLSLFFRILFTEVQIGIVWQRLFKSTLFFFFFFFLHSEVGKEDFFSLCFGYYHKLQLYFLYDCFRIISLYLPPRSFWVQIAPFEATTYNLFSKFIRGNGLCKGKR